MQTIGLPGVAPATRRVAGATLFLEAVTEPGA